MKWDYVHFKNAILEFLQLNVSTPCECHIVPIPVASLENPQSTVPMNGPQKTMTSLMGLLMEQQEFC